MSLLDTISELAKAIDSDVSSGVGEAVDLPAAPHETSDNASVEVEISSSFNEEITQFMLLRIVFGLFS